MKRTIKLLSVLAAGVLILSSCATSTKTAQVAEVQPVVCQYPTVADLEVMPKAERHTQWYKGIIAGRCVSMSVREENLVAELLAEQGADVLLEKRVIRTTRTFGMQELTVIGYPAKLKNFRTATPDDLNALKVVRPAAECPVYNVADTHGGAAPCCATGQKKHSKAKGKSKKSRHCGH